MTISHTYTLCPGYRVRDLEVHVQIPDQLLETLVDAVNCELDPGVTADGYQVIAVLEQHFLCEVRTD